MQKTNSKNIKEEEKLKEAKRNDIKQILWELRCDGL